MDNFCEYELIIHQIFYLGKWGALWGACALASSNPKQFNFKKTYPAIITICICIFSLYANAKIPYFLGLSCCAPEYSLTSFSHIKYGDNGPGWQLLGATHEKRYYAPYTYFFDSGFLKKSSLHLEQTYEKVSTAEMASRKDIVGGNYLVNKEIEEQVNGFASHAFHAGPTFNFYENNGLTDHIQSRMPVIKGTKWRPGHFNKVYVRREKPELISLDKDLKKLNKSLSLIVDNGLFSRRRLIEIYRQNAGYYRRNHKNILDKYGLKNKSNCEISHRNCN